MFSYPRGKGPKKDLNGDSIKKKRGRPKGSGKANEDKTMYAIRVTEATRIDLDQWKREFHARTYDEAIRGFIKSKINSQKKLEGQHVEILTLKEAIASHLRIQKRHAEIIDGLEDRLNPRQGQPIILEVPNS